MVRHNCHGTTTPTHPSPVKELLTGEGCVGVVIPWQLCRIIGPLTLHSQEMHRWAQNTRHRHALKTTQLIITLSMAFLTDEL